VRKRAREGETDREMEGGKQRRREGERGGERGRGKKRERVVRLAVIPYCEYPRAVLRALALG